ncbi:hypothetical protein [Roseibacillus ishigakijimensis]|uniref:Glucose/arabinose dehydrogenase, beta-propeller fold n=1 Tax=Roseibacillus ishigakijimensis TaxID=454146 RepID=A0A934RNG5_9BACT|nr:hypothetical protein [Roseibacillus ishigakijimensis]MBK1832887.1 hypothetical protein [Roseibacillus ishigakijimensis]
MTFTRFSRLFATATLVAAAEAPLWAADAYQVEAIPLPDNSPPEVGGIDFAPDGTFFVVLRRGDVFRATPRANPAEWDWQLFATGFHNGCGIDAVSRDQVRVTQMAEFTEALDTDGDGTADRYNAFASGWGLSGNYHETNTLCEDGKGGYYIAVGTASHNGPTAEHTLGDYSKFGRRGRNFASVKWRGTTLHCDAEGNLTPFCYGFRMHNGIHLDPEGNLWCGDNQGDWRAATPLYHLQEGHFYGHPSSLVWDPSWPADKDPLATFRDDLEAYNEHRTYPAVQIPHKEINRSAGEPHVIPAAFPHFAGQMLLPDNNGTRISRIMLEKVNGEFQGACTHFLDGGGLRSGNHRLRFSPDGQEIYVGQTVRGWGTPAEGLQRIRAVNKAEPFDITGFQITPTGFRLTFTQDVAEWPAASELAFSSFTYQSKWTYGSPPENQAGHAITELRKIDPRTIEVDLANFVAGKVYQLDLPALTSAGGEKVQNQLFYYTANQLPKQ